MYSVCVSRRRNFSFFFPTEPGVEVCAKNEA